MTPTLYHGGVGGLSVGGVLEPSPPHVTDGCPACVARAEGRVLTVGEFRTWAAGFGDRAVPVLRMLEGEPDGAPMDPPSAESGVYMTTHYGYALWYAARSGHGDLYEVEPIGPAHASPDDFFPTLIAGTARVVRVLRRGVWLTRRERREISREWAKRERSVTSGRMAFPQMSHRGGIA